MTYPDIAAGARRAAAGCFTLLGLAIPLSTALDNLVLGLLVLAWLTALPCDFTQWRRVLAVRPVALATCLFALIVAGLFYSDAGPRAGWSIANKYVDLFLVSVLLWAATRTNAAKYGLYMFLAAVVLNLIVSYLVSNRIFDSIPGLDSQPHYPVGFKLSVTHNIFVSFGAFVFLLYAREARTTATRAPLIGLALLCMHNVLVLVIGRTGYVVLGLLLVYFALASLRNWRHSAAAFAVIALLFAGAYSVSGNLQERLGSIVSDIAQWTPGAADRTSVGQRIEYALTTMRIIAEHPLTGVGTGGFPAAYERATTSELVTTNPHNDYLMLGAQVGVPGILLLLALYVLLWRDAGRFGSRFERDLLRGLVLTLATGGLFNSLLPDHAEGFFFAWMIAVAYALGRPFMQPAKTVPAS